MNQYGFSVSKTSYSHDCGIDLVAIYNKPLFSGKYIIQCKNWSGLVGQPEVRDLYGVVMSENANKGILITPSDYTEQAYNFAKGKNLELINGPILQAIINNDCIATENQSHFRTSQSFNYTQYDYLRECIEHNPTDPDYYIKLSNFLRSYIIEDDHCVLSEDILSKIIDINKQLINRCYHGKSNENYRKACQYKIAEIEMIRGNLGITTNILLDNGWFYLDRWYPKFHFSNGTCQPYYERILSRNLFAAFKAIGYEKGCNEIISHPIEIPFGRPAIPHGSEYGTRERIREITNQAHNNLKLFHEGHFDDYFLYALPLPSKQKLTYEPCSAKIGSIKSQREKYYMRSDAKIIEAVETSFKQHGISL